MQKIKIHIGEKIEEKVKEKGITATALGRKIGKSRQLINDIFKRNTVDSEVLAEISKALNFDFFEYYRVPDAQRKFDNKTKAKVIIELELNSDEIIKLGLEEKILEMFKK